MSFKCSHQEVGRKQRINHGHATFSTDRAKRYAANASHANKTVIKVINDSTIWTNNNKNTQHAKARCLHC